VALFVLRRRHRHRDRYEMPAAEITAADTPGRDERP
jgi:hypothetical protein